MMCFVSYDLSFIVGRVFALWIENLKIIKIRQGLTTCQIFICTSFDVRFTLRFFNLRNQILLQDGVLARTCYNIFF